MDRDRGFAREEGWRIDGWYYPPKVVSLNGQTDDGIVTRPYGYVPYQSMFDPDGRHAYDRSATQYPRMRRDEQAMGRVAETPDERALAYNVLRPSRRFCFKNDTKPLAIDYDVAITRDQGRGRSPSGMRIDDVGREPMTDMRETYGQTPRSAGREPSPYVRETPRRTPRRTVRSPSPGIRETRRQSPRRSRRDPGPDMRGTHRRTHIQGRLIDEAPEEKVMAALPEDGRDS